MKADALMRDAMKAQDCLYTLVERGIKDTNAYIVGSITAYMYAPDDPRAVIEKMANPDTHIVSLTVTENGYYHSEATNSLMTDAPEIINDLNHPEKPDTLCMGTYMKPCCCVTREVLPHSLLCHVTTGPKMVSQ